MWQPLLVTLINFDAHVNLLKLPTQTYALVPGQLGTCGFSRAAARQPASQAVAVTQVTYE